MGASEAAAFAPQKRLQLVSLLLQKKEKKKSVCIIKNENLLRGPKFYGKNEFPVEMCISQLITEILSFFCFHKNFMTNLSFKIAKKPRRVQHVFDIKLLFFSSEFNETW